MKHRSIWLEERSETMQPDQQLQTPQKQSKLGAEEVTAVQGPQRATSSLDLGEDFRPQSSVLFLLLTKSQREIY